MTVCVPKVEVVACGYVSVALPVDAMLAERPMPLVRGCFGLGGVVVYVEVAVVVGVG